MRRLLLFLSLFLIFGCVSAGCDKEGDVKVVKFKNGKYSVCSYSGAYISGIWIYYCTTTERFHNYYPELPDTILFDTMQEACKFKEEQYERLHSFDVEEEIECEKGLSSSSFSIEQRPPPALGMNSQPPELEPQQSSDKVLK